MSIQALRERRQETSRLANHLLAEKGAQAWTKEDQAKFDEHVDEMNRLDSQISAHQKMLDDRAESTFKDAPKKEKGAPELTDMQRGLEIFLRRNPREMTQEEATLIRNTMSTTTTTQGGYTVQTDIARTFVDYLKDYGGMRRVADRIITAMGNPMSFPTTDGRAEVGELVAQNASAAALDASFGTVPLTTYKFGSKIIAVPIELLQDSQIDVTALVQKRMRDRIGRIQNQLFTSGLGDGSTQPFGLTTAASVGVTGATGTTTTITYDSLVGLIESVDYAYQAEGGFTWMTSQTLRGVIRKLKDTAGRPIFLPGYGAIDQELGDTLLGFTLQINNDMPFPAANALSLSFGQHKKYLIRDALEVTLFRFDDSVYVSKGQVGFLAWARAGGNLLDAAAVSLYKHSAT
jgi:HK97 family phage major capsid protein